MDHIVLDSKVDNLHVFVLNNREDLGKLSGNMAAEKIKAVMKQKGKVRMIFAAAPSQNEFLDTLAEVQGIDWNNVTVFHMDEYLGLKQDSPQLFSRYVSERLFDKVKPGTVHLICPNGDSEKECQRYEELLLEEPIDIVCMGIGENGHIAFNDPPAADFFEYHRVKKVKLDDVCRQQQVHDGCFGHMEDVPTHALSLTVPTLLSADSIFCMVPGKTKQNAVSRTLHNNISTEVPSTVLRIHKNCTMFLDRDAYGQVEQGKR